MQLVLQLDPRALHTTGESARIILRIGASAWRPTAEHTSVITINANSSALSGAFPLAADGVLRSIWHRRFCVLLAKVREGEVEVNGQPLASTCWPKVGRRTRAVAVLMDHQDE